MTNEQLVKLIQQEKSNEFIPILWERTRCSLYKTCDIEYNRNIKIFKRCGVELCDIRQACYEKFEGMIYEYNDSKGYVFTTYLKFLVKRVIVNLTESKTGKKDTLNYCKSLNTKINDDEDSEIGDFILDKESSNFVDNIENESEAEEIWKIVDQLEPLQKMVIINRYKENKKKKEMVEILNISNNQIRLLELKALRKLRANKAMQKIAVENGFNIESSLTSEGLELFEKYQQYIKNKNT